MSLFRMNCSFCNVSKSDGSLMMILSAPSSCGERQDDVFAGHRLGHQFDDGGGMVTSVRSTNCMPWNSAMAAMTCSLVA